jgi:GNAT superfamily N-acetyltransferase
MAANPDLAVRLLDNTDSHDARLVELLADLVNDVYATAESGLWRDGATRTTAAEMAELVAAGQIAVATTPDGQVVGSVRIHQISDDTSEFGMLVAAPDRRGAGIGRALVDFVEQDSWSRGLRAIQLELLVPRARRHPGKEFLRAWYGRRGYRLIRIRRIDDTHPHLAPLLATPCDLEVYEKPLATRTTNLAAELAESGPTKIEDELTRFVEAALRLGADPLLAAIVLDRGLSDVVRQRAFGAVHEQVAGLQVGGGGGIRTHGGREPTHAFEACSFGRSDTPPRVRLPDVAAADRTG